MPFRSRRHGAPKSKLGRPDFWERKGSIIRGRLGAGRNKHILVVVEATDAGASDLAREVRKNRNIPIIMLTGKGDAIDRVVGLEVGANNGS